MLKVSTQVIPKMEFLEISTRRTFRQGTQSFFSSTTKDIVYSENLNFTFSIRERLYRFTYQRSVFRNVAARQIS